MSKERPWEAGPFEKWVVDELDFRKNSLSTGIQGQFKGDLTQYAGPRKAWTRVFSNGMVEYPNGNANLISDNDNEWGLVFASGDGFFNRYGIDGKSPYGVSKQMYGYNCKLQPKYIESSTRPNIPDPGIISIETEIQKSWFAKAKINWTCHSIEQLKAITPYFLTPLQTVIVEFGWNTFNQQSLINLSDFNQIIDIWDNHYNRYSEYVPKSKGNYEFLIGQVINFEYTINDNIITGMTEVASRQLLYSGFRKDSQENIIKGKIIDKDGKLDSKETEFRTKYKEMVKTFVNSVTATDNQGNSQSGLNEDFAKILKSNDGYVKKYGAKFENLPDHIFSGRNKQIIKYSAERDFDTKNKKGPDFTWITMDLLVDVLNGMKNIDGVKDYTQYFFDLNIDDITIGAHDNLISTKKTILIPNSKAPKLNSRFSDRLEKVALGNAKKDTISSIASAVSNIQSFAIATSNTSVFAAADAATDGRISLLVTELIFGPQPIQQNIDPARAGRDPDARPQQTFVESLTKTYNALNVYDPGSVPDLDKNGKPKGFPVLDQSYDEHSPTGSFSFKKNNNVGADCALAKTAGFLGTLQRQDLDYILNRWGRPVPNSRDILMSEDLMSGDTMITTLVNTAIPAIDQTFGGTRVPDDLKRGYLKNIYINLEFLKTLLNDENNKNLKEVYDAICKEINDACCNFWELTVVDAPDVNGKSTLKIVDTKGPPDKNYTHEIYKFEYMTNNSIIKKLNFTTNLSNAQANQIIFKAGAYDYTTSNQLLDYSNLQNNVNSKKPKVVYTDRILKTKSTDQPVDNKKDTDTSEIYFKEILKDGNKYSEGYLQVTLFGEEKNVTSISSTAVSGDPGRRVERESGKSIDYKTYDIVDIIMPYEELVVSMLNDGDLKTNTNIYNAPLRNVEIEISLMGISGIKTFEFFRVTNLPPPFNDDVVVFQVTNVTHVVNENTWETRLKAQLRPAYNLMGK
jgi:hypothetical protein